MTSALRFLGRLHDAVVSALAAVAAAIAAGLVVLICVDVAGRNMRIGNIPWTNEATEYALLAMTLFGAPWVLSLGAHVRMDLFTKVLPPKGTKVLEVSAGLLGAGVCATLSWFGVAATMAAYARGSLILKTLVFPEWILLSATPFTMILLTIGFLRRAVDIARDRPEAKLVAGAG